VPAWAHAQVSPSLTLLRLPCARIQYHKTFAGLARRGKTSTDTLIVNDRGELLDFVLTPGNVNPCPQAYSPSETRDTYRRDELWRRSPAFALTSLMPLLDKLLLRRRAIDQFLAD
jgi:hypothetical protein